MERRVVITGLGAVCGLGVGVGPLWEGLLAGRSGLRRISLFDPSGFRSRLAAEVPGFTGAKDYVPKSYRKAVKVMARDTELAVAAAKLAVEDAGLVTRGTLPEGSADPTTYPGSRMGCHIGAGLIAAETNELTMAMATAAMSDVGSGMSDVSSPPDSGVPSDIRHPTSHIRHRLDLRAWGNADGGAGAMNNLPPLWLLKYLPNMLACHVTIIHGAEGPSNTITCAEASGLLSIGESVRVIERADADLCFTGGAEAPINHMRLLRMDLPGRLAPTGDSGDGPSFIRPYDPAAAGGLVGEGGGILIVESLDTAAKRKARIHAEIAGYGAAQSAPPRAGWIAPPGADLDEGTQFAIENALDDAGLSPAEVDAIVPHAAGIPAYDRGEAGTLRAVFGPRLKDIPLVTLTPALGDGMAAAGGLAVAVAAKCLSEQMLPARLHGGTPPADLQAGSAPARPTPLRHILVATGALGGQNAALILRRAPEPPA